ncbi:MAG: xanthine dehydrogenase family protein molybdopterin-binding subunit [Pseudomonadota bacterium]
MVSEARPKNVGARVQRVEDPRLLTGNGRYVDDIKLHGTLHVAVLRSDYAHARILEVDTAEAARMPGVVGVFTAKDFHGEIKPIYATSNMKNYHATPLKPLADGIVHYSGQPIAVVVADDRYLAEDAVGSIAVDFQQLDELVDAEAAAAEDTVPMHAGLATNVLVARKFSKGEADEAMERASVRVKERFRMRRKSPVALENRSYLADFDKGRNALTLYSSTQVPGIIRDALVEVLDMPGSKIRVVAPDVGGGFGSKSSLYPEEVLVCVLARRFGQPVKWVSDRLEDLISTNQAFDELVDAELGLDGEGNLLALRAEIIGDVGAFSIYPWTAALEPMQVAGFLPGPYRLENYSASVRAVSTNKPPTGPYRGVGRPAATFVMERLMDMAAKQLSMDPRDIRRRNFVRGEDFPYKIGSGIVWDRSGFTECLELACEKAGYDELRRIQVAARAAGRWFGIGIASYAELTGIGSRMSAAPGMPINTGTETAEIQIDSSGSITATFGIASHGQGLETTLAQVIADELGVRVEDVEIVHGDTATIAHSTGTYASRSAVIAGGAATLSARALREKVVEAAAFLLEADAEDIEIHEGLIHVSGTNRKMDLPELAHAVYSEMGRIPIEIRENLDLRASKFYDPVFGTTSSATHIAAVDIDPQTYFVTVKRFVVAEDCGRMINPLIVDGQVHGGVAQGIGAALLEEVVHDETGQILTASLVDYVVPSACEVPKIEVFHLESEAPSTVGGYRGMGEGGTIGAPAAIANAIADAVSHLNIDICELPVTPDRLFRLVRAANDAS